MLQNFYEDIKKSNPAMCKIAHNTSALGPICSDRLDRRICKIQNGALHGLVCPRLNDFCLPLWYLRIPFTSISQTN